VGTARTALFNYLFARHHGGTFVLRIEDTDLERSDSKYVDDIYQGLKLLGLDWDEGPDKGGPYGPYLQSERLVLYRAYAQSLVDSGAAYPCYCTPEELEAEKQQAILEKRPYVYSRRCCNAETVEQLKADPNRKPALRFKIPDHPQTIVLPDLIRGDVSFETALIGDFVILKSNGVASYNFAVVVDDIAMKISHVIRGEDHIPNTPKQMLLYQAMAEPCPAFAHVGMILAPDRSKLSKRHGATAVAEFVRNGYLPEAFTNFLALLGWSPTDGEEIGTLSHFAELFTLERVAHSPAVFDIEKLNWLNGVTIRNMPLETLLEKARPFLADLPLETYTDAQLCQMLEAVREPLTQLSELPDAVSYFFGNQPTILEEAQGVFAEPDTRTVLQGFLSDVLPGLDFSAPETISAGVKAFANGLKPLKMKTVMWALRAATTGRVHGADLGKVLSLLGPQQVTARITWALTQCSQTAPSA